MELQLMEKFEKELADLKEMVKDMHQLLVGHQHAEEIGLIHWKKETDKRVSNLEKFKDKLIWIAVGMSIPTGLGVFKIVQIVVQYIK